MLYLIRTFGRNKKTLLKIGWTENPIQRFNTYRVENPFFEIIAIREGDEYTETVAHLYLTSLGLKANILDEWFIDCPETLKAFHFLRPKAERAIWNSRENLWNAGEFKAKKLTMRVRIYEDLRFLHRNENLNKEIDKAWKLESGKKNLKNIKEKLDLDFLIVDDDFCS
jgi:hypothetical protein